MSLLENVSEWRVQNLDFPILMFCLFLKTYVTPTLPFWKRKPTYKDPLRKLTPLKINGPNLKITQLDRKIIFQTSLFWSQNVNFPGCIFQAYGSPCSKRSRGLQASMAIDNGCLNSPSRWFFASTRGLASWESYRSGTLGWGKIRTPELWFGCKDLDPLPKNRVLMVPQSQSHSPTS